MVATDLFDRQVRLAAKGRPSISARRVESAQVTTGTFFSKRTGVPKVTEPRQWWRADGASTMRLVLHGVLACTLLLVAGTQPASAGSTVATAIIQCCHTVGSGATMCQVKTRRACQNNGGTDMGPGTCNPNPCGGVPPCGTFLLKWGIKSGTGNGQFLGPLGVATDASGHVYVADDGNARIQKFDASGTFLTTWGGAGSGNGQFNCPTGVATDGSGNVYVSDHSYPPLRKFDAGSIFLNAGIKSGTGNGQFHGPHGVATDGSGNVYVSDTNNNRVQKFDASGTFLTAWGSYGTGTGQFE